MIGIDEIFLNMRELMKMSEKIKQYTTTLNCECPGYPNAHSLARLKDAKRIKCGRSVTMKLALGQSYMGNRQEIQRKLRDMNWTKLKTYGVFQNFCPSCTQYILKKREDNKAVWG